MYVSMDGAASNRIRERREVSEQLLALAEHLAPSDRELIRSVYDRGIALRALARAANVSPHVLQNRVRRLMKRMSSPMFTAVLRAMSDWPPVRREIAANFFLRGRTQRDTATIVGITLHQTRIELERIRGQLETTTADKPIR